MNQKRHDIYVAWEKPRRFTVKMYRSNSTNNLDTYHRSVGVVALSVMTAIESAQRAYPDYRIDSVNDTGQVDIVADMPVRNPQRGQWVEIEGKL